MKDALRNKILGGTKPRVDVVPLKALGGEQVEVVALRGREVFTLRAECLDGETKDIDNAKFWPALIVAAVRDPDSHERLFSKGDVESLMENEYALIEELVKHIQRLCSIADVKSEEEVLKNSSRTTSISGTRSSSPNASEA